MQHWMQQQRQKPRRLLADKRGSALLVALLVMGILIGVSLGLSSLILRETRITKDVLDSGRAFYAAESGVEVALYGLQNSLPGWEPAMAPNDDFRSLTVGEDLVAVAEYQVDNRCNAYPCFDKDYDVVGDSGEAPPLRAFYDVLDLNESITIPLFIYDGEQVQNVDHFTVEYFANFTPQEHLAIEPAELSGWDVLRWKIIGLKDLKGGEKATETIGDFTAVSSIQNVGDGSDDFLDSNAQKPSWFGTGNCGDFERRYNDGIRCLPVLASSRVNFTEKIIVEDMGQIAKVNTAFCNNTEAREYYEYQYDPTGQRRIDEEDVKVCYPIADFLRTHELNYLTLTNLVNPAVFRKEFDDEENKAFLSKIFYRVELFSNGDVVGGSDCDVEENAEVCGGNQTVRELARIVSNGYSGDVRKSVEVRMRRGGFMPVFHFSLYSTSEQE
jgi:hypothetical protein